MKKRGLLFWFPRLLSVLFILFLSMFSLNVFYQSLPLLETFTAFFIHLLPSILLLIILLFACRHEFMGGILFVVLGFVYLTKGWNFPWQAKLAICLPLFLIGILFICNSLKGGEKMACGLWGKKKPVKKKTVKKKTTKKKLTKKKTVKKKPVKRKTTKKKITKKKTTKRR